MKINAEQENIKSSHTAPSEKGAKGRFGKNQQKRKNTPRPPKKVTAEWMRNSGLYYLQRYAASIEHFRSVMMRKIDKSCRAHPDQDRDECIRILDGLLADFIRSGLLNDKTYAEGVVTSLRRRGASRRAIINRLQTKGIDSETTAALLETHDGENGISAHDDGDFPAALRLARRRRIGPYAPPDKMIDRDKAIAMLGRAGFQYSIARRVVDMNEEELNDYNASDL